jgi:hypothetical protein
VPGSYFPRDQNTSGWGLIGGTSASSPACAAVFSQVNDFLIERGDKPLGVSTDPVLRLYSKLYPAFHDITVGTSEGCNTTGFPYVQLRPDATSDAAKDRGRLGRLDRLRHASFHRDSGAFVDGLSHNLRLALMMTVERLHPSTSRLAVSSTTHRFINEGIRHFATHSVGRNEKARRSSVKSHFLPGCESP